MLMITALEQVHQSAVDHVKKDFINFFMKKLNLILENKLQKLVAVIDQGRQNSNFLSCCERPNNLWRLGKNDKKKAEGPTFSHRSSVLLHLPE